MFSRGDMLLYAVSARRQLSWRQFTEILDRIFVADVRVGNTVEEARSAVADLGSALGHWDIVSAGRGVQLSIAPPVLASLPRPGLPTAVLCGSRSPDTLPAIRGAAVRHGVRVRAERRDSLHPFAPTRIEVMAESHELIAGLASEIGVGHNTESAAWTLALSCGYLHEYVASLTWTTEGDLNWPSRRFDPVRLRFVRQPDGAAPEDAAGLRLVAYMHPDGWAWQDRLWRGREFALVNRDWGRFAVLADRGIQVLSYERVAGTQTVPRQVPLPGIAARSLALCSGDPPKMEHGEGLGNLVYSDVPVALSEAVCARLGQHSPDSVDRAVAK